MSFDELASQPRPQAGPDLARHADRRPICPIADRAKAIFALPLNEVSQPLKSGFGGLVLMRVTKITPGSNKTLADVKEDIRKTLPSQLAANKLVDVVNAYTDAQSGGGDLEGGGARRPA